ncbi:MAG TPA: CapA family protein, partial [Cyclobacteriaceae bacterium]|nr:CapA family protein [Cyclobacteriaceae bacterium]
VSHSQTQDSVRSKKDTITVIGVGDIMMGSNYPLPVLPPADGAYLMKDVEHILRDADVTFGNLEGVLLNEGGTVKKCRDPKVCYAFRSPEHYVQNLVNAGFDVMSLANNHAGDFGDAGRKSTIKTLEEAGIHHTGQLPKRYVTFEKEGIKFGVAAFSPNSNCISVTHLQQAKAIVQELDTLVDIVIVSFHGGAEGAQYQNVPRKNEIFHGEDRGDVYKFSHMLIDAGADIIFGHGPHVTRAIEVYKNRFIAYSLGNFCTYGGINVAGINGWAPIIKVYTNPEGHFIKAQITPTYQIARDRVKIDIANRVITKMQELTKKDFPEVPVRIDDKGLITYLAQQDGL